MTTTTATAEEGRVATDLEELALKREARFNRRRARFDADPTMDPRVRRWYLDRTIWNTQQFAAETDMMPSRVSTLRSGSRKPGRKSPHPSILPPKDTVEGVLFGVEQPGVEAGRARQWCVQRGTHKMDPETGALTRKGGSTQGRPRAERPSLSTLLRKPRKSED